MTHFIAIMALAALGAVGGTHERHTATGPGDHRATIISWAPADSADSLWRQARRAISDEDWTRAEQLFQRIRDRFPKSAYAADSYYWQAFALYQRGGNTALKKAVALLDLQQRFATAETVKSGDAKALGTRIRGQLAQGGDASSAEEISRRAAAAADARPSAEARAVSRSASARRANGERTSSGCKEDDQDDRIEALNALLQMDGEQAMPILKKVLARRDTCSEVLRRKAVFLVSQKRSDEAADILMATAKNDPDEETREQAVFWLGQVSGEKSVGLLEQILKTSNDEGMQDKALFALTQTNDPRGYKVIRDYATRDGASAHLREQAIFWLGQQRSEDNAQFLKQLYGKTTDEEIQQKILFSLSQMRGFGNDQWLLDQAVNTKSPMEVRKQALFWAAQSGSVDVARLGSLYDKGTEVEFRKQVIFTLSQRSKSSEAVDKLIQISRTEKDHELRKQALFWLGQSRDPRAVKALMEVLDK